MAWILAGGCEMARTLTLTTTDDGGVVVGDATMLLVLGSTVDTCSSSCRTVEAPLSVRRQSGVYCSFLQRQVRTV